MKHLTSNNHTQHVADPHYANTLSQQPPSPQHKFLHELFEQQAKQFPDQIALVFADRVMSFGDLNCRANQLAHFLRKSGVGPEVCVGLQLERSFQLVIGMLGILKAGGTCIPLEATYSKDRLFSMIQDGNPPIILTQATLLSSLPEFPGGRLCLDTDMNFFLHEPSENPPVNFDLDNAAFLFFTSGSTGRPKGVIWTHQTHVKHVLWAADKFGLTPNDHYLMKCPISFIPILREIFWPLSTGGKIIMARPHGEKDFAYLVGLIAEEHISITSFVPSALQVFLEEDSLSRCKSLRHIFCGGEALSAELQKKFFDRVDVSLHKFYGTTEAPGATYFPCTRENTNEAQSLGSSIHTAVYVLDSRMHPVALEEVGEIYLECTGRTRGYLNQSDLTAEKFVPNPFSLTHGHRLYKTGDFARRLEYGRWEFVGRQDQQVKIRGHRVELDGIEATIRKIPTVQEVVVLCQEDDLIEKRIIAYVVLTPAATLTSHDLRNDLKESLPDYMVPSAFVILDFFPLTSNGKIDRKSLPTHYQENLQDVAPYVAPRTPIEEILQELWEQVLKIDSIGIHDNFFDLGGHSLLAMQLISRIRNTLKIGLPLLNIFDTPSIAGLAETIELILSSDSSEKGKFGEKASDHIEVEF